MKVSRLSTLIIAAVIGLSSLVSASEEHSDIEFVFADGKIDVEFGDEGAVFEGEFPIDGTDLQFTAEPGFGSELEEGGGLIGYPGAQVAYNVLSDLMFWNDGPMDVPDGAQIRIVNAPPSPVVPDTVVGVGTGTQMGSFDPVLNRIGAAEDDGDFHNDLPFFLEPDTGTANPSMYGAYGFMVSLTTDADGIEDSEKFALVFNFGLEEEKFEEGVEYFASQVPEPTGPASLLGALIGCLAFARRRNR